MVASSARTRELEPWLSGPAWTRVAARPQQRVFRWPAPPLASAQGRQLRYQRAATHTWQGPVGPKAVPIASCHGPERAATLPCLGQSPGSPLNTDELTQIHKNHEHSLTVVLPESCNALVGCSVLVLHHVLHCSLPRELGLGQISKRIRQSGCLLVMTHARVRFGCVTAKPSHKHRYGDS